jgi:hypothetical protein
MTSGEAAGIGKETMANAPMGKRLDSIGRYKMPLLAGESGPKAGGDWVPGGLQSMTNLASSISDTKALMDWTVRQVMIGMGLHPDLIGEVRNVVWAAKQAGADFQNLRAHKELTADLDQLAERAKDISGANAARDAGIVLHDTWEARGTRGARSGAEEHDVWIDVLAELLDGAGFDVIPELCERTVRNVAVQAAGRFDNILMHRCTGQLYMADLKTKRKPFWSMLEIDAQLAGYAYAEWMLSGADVGSGADARISYYVDGPQRLGVHPNYGVVLHMPSDGSRPRLRKADLAFGWNTLQLARGVCTARSFGRSVGRMAESFWGV